MTADRYSIGKPIAELPGHGNQRTPSMWEAVAQAVKAQPGLWFPIELPERSPTSIAGIAARIHGSTKGCPVALRQGFDGAMRGGVLHVRYVGAES